MQQILPVSHPASLKTPRALVQAPHWRKAPSHEPCGLLLNRLPSTGHRWWGWMVDRWNRPAGQGESHRQGCYDLRMLFLLAFCLAVMIFPVLCLFITLCFFLSLYRGNLLVDWATTVASLRNGLDCWVDSKVLLSSFGLP